MIKKKYLVCLICLISSFIFIGSVSAANISIDYDHSKFQILDNNIDVVEHAIELVNQYNVNDYNTLITFYSSGGYYTLTFGLETCTSNRTIDSLDYNPSSGYIYPYFNSSQTDSYRTKVCPNGQYSYPYHLSLTNNLSQSNKTNFYNNIINILTNGTTSNSMMFAQYGSSSANLNYLNNNNFVIPVWSNRDMYFEQQNMNRTNTLTINGTTYSYHEQIPTYYEYKYANNTPEISFTTQNYISNNKIYKKDITIDYGYLDNNNYIYLYKYSDENNWTTVNLINNTSITLNLTENKTIIAKVIDRSSNEDVDSATYTVTGIESYFNINFTPTYTYDEVDNIISSSINIEYSTINHDLYDYQYQVVTTGSNFETLNSSLNSINITIIENKTIIARIIDKSNSNILKSVSYTESRILNNPKISFKIKQKNLIDYEDNPNLKVIDSVNLMIDYGYLDNNNYIYLYKDDYYSDSWTTVNLTNDKYIIINLDHNTNIIAKVLNSSTNEVITSATYKVSAIGEILNENDTLSMEDIFVYVSHIDTSRINFIKAIWEMLKEHATLYSYILLVISTSIIILIIKSMNKN